MRQSTRWLPALLGGILAAPAFAELIGEPSGTGPFPSTAESRPELPGHTVYRPGGPSDIAHENAVDDVARIDRVPVFFGALPVGHGGTFAEPDGGEWARVSARWLGWQLKNDADASWDFAGKDCRLCADERWTVEQKRLPPPDGPFRESVYVPVLRPQSWHRESAAL